MSDAVNPEQILDGYPVKGLDKCPRCGHLFDRPLEIESEVDENGCPLCRHSVGDVE